MLDHSRRCELSPCILQDATETVGTLKALAMVELKVTNQNAQLYAKGKPLSDTATLAEAGLTQNELLEGVITTWKSFG